MRIARTALGLAVLVLLLVTAAAYARPRLEERPGVPHPIPGRVDCVSCHGANAEWAEEHQGRTNDSCLQCHALSDTTGIPTIPHPTEGREDCVMCHGPGQVKPYPADHEGRTKESCLGCHQVGAATPSPSAIAGAPAPAIPHSTEGREDCVACHGLGQMKPFPADHEGRTKETCLGCHEGAASTATPPLSVEVVPTPIQEPELFAENSCVACHRRLEGASEQITGDWEQSVHAGQGVGCVSCHGGDPNQADAAAAMSAGAGFLGVPSRGQIPGLCASCHSDVELMRPYGVATDQYRQYWQSQHGQALLGGDQEVATCFDCHDGHKVLKVKDPASLVYPTNEPGMCAGCHGDEALMARYGIPADQYGLYQGSVHGVAALEKQDQRAPTCSTCHGKHGAAPPGYEEVANVCGQCHAKTEEYYLQGAHRSGMTGAAAPRCATCHGEHDVQPASLELFVGEEEGHCGSCHPEGGPGAEQAEAMHKALTGADVAYAQAEGAIAQASAQHLIVAEEEELLQKANTPLIEAQAVQHTVSVAEVEAKTAESVELSRQAQASAEAAVEDVGRRRIGMVVTLGVILVVIVCLVLIKRELDRELKAKQAGQKSRA